MGRGSGALFPLTCITMLRHHRWIILILSFSFFLVFTEGAVRCASRRQSGVGLEYVKGKDAELASIAANSPDALQGSPDGGSYRHRRRSASAPRMKQDTSRREYPDRDAYAGIPGRLGNRTRFEDLRDYSYRPEAGGARDNGSLDWESDYSGGQGYPRPYDKYDPHDGYRNETDFGSSGGQTYNTPDRDRPYDRDDRSPPKRGAMGRDVEFGKDEDDDRGFGRDRDRNGYGGSRDKDRDGRGYPDDRSEPPRGPRDGDYIGDGRRGTYDTGNGDEPRDRDGGRRGTYDTGNGDEPRGRDAGRSGRYDGDDRDEPRDRDDYGREDRPRKGDRYSNGNGNGNVNGNGNGNGYGSYGDDDEDSCPVETQETKSSNNDFPMTTASAVLSTPIGDFILYCVSEPGKAIVSYSLKCQDREDPRGKEPLYTPLAHPCFQLNIVEDLSDPEKPQPLVIALSRGGHSIALRVAYDMNQFRLEPCQHVLEYPYLTDVAIHPLKDKQGHLVVFSNNDVRNSPPYEQTVAPIYIVKQGNIKLGCFVDIRETTDVDIWYYKGRYILAFVHRIRNTRRCQIRFYEVEIRDGQCVTSKPWQKQPVIGGSEYYGGERNKEGATHPFSIEQGLYGCEDVKFLVSPRRPKDPRKRERDYFEDRDSDRYDDRRDGDSSRRKRREDSYDSESYGRRNATWRAYGRADKFDRDERDYEDRKEKAVEPWKGTVHLAVAIANDARPEGSVGCPPEELISPVNDQSKSFCGAHHAVSRSFVIAFEHSEERFVWNKDDYAFQFLLAGPDSATEITHLPTEKCCMVFQVVSPLGITSLFSIENDENFRAVVHQFSDSGLPPFSERSSFGFCTPNDLILSYSLHSYQPGNTIFHFHCNAEEDRGYGYGIGYDSSDRDGGYGRQSSAQRYGQRRGPDDVKLSYDVDDRYGRFGNSSYRTDVADTYPYRNKTNTQSYNRRYPPGRNERPDTSSYPADDAMVGNSDPYRRPFNISQPYGQASTGSGYAQPNYSLAAPAYNSPPEPGYNTVPKYPKPAAGSPYPKPHLPPPGPPQPGPSYGPPRITAVYPDKDYGNMTFNHAPPPQYAPVAHPKPQPQQAQLPQQPQLPPQAPPPPPIGGYAIPYNAPNRY